MSDSLLATKLHLPTVRPGRVTRHRLLERLNESRSRRLTLVSAPAGFGKTTLLSTWLEGEQSFAWLTMDEGDNDPVRFLSYFVAMFQQIDERIGRAVHSAINASQLPAAEAAMTMLINDAVASGRHLTLILDDYHLIEHDYIHTAIRFLLENQPPTMHMVILTREDPPFSLAALRARDELVELRAGDLRFTPEETRQFLRDSMGLELPAGVINILEQRIEGWAAGLQMAALSLKGQQDVASFVGSFGGVDAFVLDYLTEEVLRHQPEHVQAFLLHTSILDRLYAPLCDALTGRSDSQDILETLQHENLFLIPLDNRRQYYRYYHLFLDVLRNHLARTDAALIPELHRRAAGWYAQHNLLKEAIDHALKGEDYEQAAGLIEQVVQDTLMRGDVPSLERWLESLPEDVMLSHPDLCLFHTIILALLGKLSEAKSRLQDALQAAGRDPSPVFTAKVSAIESILGALRWEDWSGVFERGQYALDHLPASSVLLRDIAMWSMAMGHYLSGDEATAQQLFGEAVSSSIATGDMFVTLLALYLLAVTQMTLGYLNRVEEFYRQMASIIDLQEHHVTLSGLASLAYGDLLRERGDLERAERYLEEGITVSRQMGTPVFLANSYIDLARTRHARGDVEAAFDTLNQAEQYARQEGAHPHTIVQVEACRMQMLIAGNRLRETDRWLEERSRPGHDTPFTLYPDTPFVREMENFALARILLAHGRHGEALPLVEQTLGYAPYKSVQIEGLILKGLALHAAGEAEAAFVALAESLAQGEPEGFCRVFANEGAPMASLLRDYLRAAHVEPIIERYARYLLDTIESPARAHEAPRREPPVLAEPVSDRERDVLALVGEGLTNQEIALELALSLNTIKWHLYNVYGKLNVRNRTEAVARARELGLLVS